MLLKCPTKIRRPCNFFCLLLLTYFCLYQYCRISFYADSTSYFFNPNKAFAPGYSSQRQEEAFAFLEDSSNLPFKRLVNSSSPKICIGITSIAREGVSYLYHSTGSLLEGLSNDERQQIELKILIAHTNATIHPNWNSNWLRNVADEVLDYGPPFENESYIRVLEGNVDKENQKSLFDYAHLLRACRNTQADYVLMIEDDTVSAKGWYERTMEGLEAVARKMRSMGYTSNACKLPFSSLGRETHKLPLLPTFHI
jgi:hypothetical protein